MNINTRFHGVLADFIASDTVRFEMGSRPTYGDLLDEIGHRFGRDMPSELWDASKNRFQGSILAVGDKRNLKSMDTPLKADEDITFYIMLAGG